MFWAVDERPIILAALALTLLLAWATFQTGDLTTFRTPDLDFRTAAVDTPALPDYAAHLAACEPGSGLPRCPGSVPVRTAVVGRVVPGFGADGRLDAGGADRFDVAVTDGTLSLQLDGDLGATVGVYAAGAELVDPADGRRHLDDIGLPTGVQLVQVVVVNQTPAPRTYRLMVE